MHCILFTTTPRDKPALAGAAKAKRTRWIQLLGKDVLSLERTQACFEYIEGDALLEYDLPKRPSMLPGEKLKHCYDVMDKMLEAQKPCVFKVGYTHCPYFRFYNKKFGYTYDPYDKWEKMVVIYCSSEAISPGYIEAAIIQRHKGILNALMAKFELVFQIFLVFYLAPDSYIKLYTLLLRTTRVSK